ncbi:hypothetical protein SUGI_0800600 [Cryptomeria japonica]|nr:hypothetical protein SUGI_0800600 [Cryptomeria japonica]
MRDIGEGYKSIGKSLIPFVITFSICCLSHGIVHPQLVDAMHVGNPLPMASPSTTLFASLICLLHVQICPWNSIIHITKGISCFSSSFHPIGVDFLAVMFSMELEVRGIIDVLSATKI